MNYRNQLSYEYEVKGHGMQRYVSCDSELDKVTD